MRVEVARTDAGRGGAVHRVSWRLLVVVAMLAATVVAMPPASFAAHDFDDVPDDHPFHGEISWLVDAGIATGYDDGTFRPSIEVTRQAVAAFLYRVAGEPDGEHSSDFTDVPASHPFHDAIAWAADEGITTGYEDGTFRPGANVTRQAAAAFVFRAAGEPDGDWGNDFADVPADHPFAEAISWMDAMAIAGGYDDGTFRPGADVTRQAIAAFLFRWDDAQPDATVAGSVEQVYLYGADPHTPARLLDPEGEPVANHALDWSVRDSDFTAGGGTTDANGALVFRGTLDPDLLEFSGITPGESYRVEYVAGGATRLSPELTVLAPDEHPDQAFYDGQQLEEGSTFIETRDGTQLSVHVDLPGPADAGPYPTLVEYSGYAVSAPPDPDAPLGLNVGAPMMAIGQLLDYATVAVNIRGTGCSGGAFDYFETLQALDGYDAIEAIAAQDWSANVATAGISYPGISQLFVAATQPPSLTAAAPMAVISDHARDTVYPGGIYNTGFAVEWAEERELDTRYPGGQSWVETMVDSDHPASAQCGENVQLRGQNLPLRDRIEANEYANDLWATRSPYDFASDITTDLFIVNSWQDEQTGGRAAALLDALDLDRDDRIVRFTGTNGTHVETMGPEVLTDLMEFLELHLAERTPAIAERGSWLSGELNQATFEDFVLPFLYENILGDDIAAEDVPIPEDRFTGQSYEDARATYRAEAPARILFETGAGEGPDGFPYPAYSERFAFDQLPNLDPGFDAADARRYLRADGSLTVDEPAEDEGRASYVYDPEADDARVYNFAERPGNSEVWQLQPPYLWTQPDEERSLAFDTPAFDDDQVMVGSASVDLWLASDLRDTDLEVVLSEVRPDGNEMYVTTGWLRASKRALDEDSTALRPRPSFAADDAAPLASGLNEVRVETFPFGHLFREDSKLRLTIEAPGGNRPLWRFDGAISGGPGVENHIAHTEAAPSSIVLPIVGPPTGELPPLPDCSPSDGEDGGMTAVRGQPCRDADRSLPGGSGAELIR